MTMLDTTAASLGANAPALSCSQFRHRPPGVIDIRTFCATNVIRIIVIWNHFNKLQRRRTQGWQPILHRPAQGGAWFGRRIGELMLTKHTNCIYPVEYRFVASDSGMLSLITSARA